MSTTAYSMPAMQFSPSWRKALLLIHLICSLAWMGAIAVYLVLALKGLAGTTELGTRAAYLGMQDAGWAAVVPLGFASVTTGIFQALGTPWGIFRNYWVLVKLVISVVALAILMLHMGPTDTLARAAANGTWQMLVDLRGSRLQLVMDAALALLVLLVASVLGTYKPRGQTPWAAQGGDRPAAAAAPGRWFRVLVGFFAVMLGLIVLAHLTGHSPHQH